MKIALIGYGKMGKAIEAIALERKHDIIARFGKEGIDTDLLKQADVAIEFTHPEAAFTNIATSLKSGIPVVTGTTGWMAHYEEAEKLCKENNGAMLAASNFSLGVNLFFNLNRRLAALMDNYPSYDVAIEEIHHTEKLDAPSGTAISLAEQIADEMQKKEGWTMDDDPTENQILIKAKREPGVKGTHIIEYTSEIDTIEIKHTAHSRKGFALGAVIAAEYLAGKQGVYTMNDVLNL